jgi:hypothetical protein
MINGSNLLDRIHSDLQPLSSLIAPLQRQCCWPDPARALVAFEPGCIFQPCGVLRAAAACKFVGLKRALGYTEAEARRELATRAPHATACGAAGVWLGHHPHRTEVTYAYVPRPAQIALRASSPRGHAVCDTQPSTRQSGRQCAC